MDRIGDVGTHAPVEVLGGEDRPLAGLRREPGGHVDRAGGVEAVVEPPGRLPRRDPDRFGVDGGVGDPHLGGLERGQRDAELRSGR